MAATLECDLPELFDIDSMVDESLANTCTLFDENMVADTFLEPCSFFDSVKSLSSIVQVQKTQDRSPFHESDSGVSEVSEFCGDRSPARDSIMLDEMLDNMPTTPFLVEVDPDLNLMNYLSAETNDNEIELGNGKPQSRPQTRMSTRHQVQVTSQAQKAGESRNTKTVSSKKVTPRVVLRGRRSLNKLTKSCQSSSVSETEESDIEVGSDENVVPKAKSPRGSVRVSRPGSTLPSVSESRSTSTNCNVTSVKIVRVVNPNSSDVQENDVVKALEDRNRKNAEVARVNRLKKKAYVDGLEKEVKEGRVVIDQLEAKLNDAELERDACRREISYLKSVLANQSALAGLLKNIPNATNVRLSSSISSQKRGAELDHSYGSSKRSRPSEPSSTAGVCLHVDNDSVSLEFCHHCAEKAARSSNS